MNATLKTLQITLLFIISFFLVQVSQGGEISGNSVCLPSNWPSEVSDLPVDPEIHQSELANGFRYVLKQNLEPKNRVAVYLYVKAGSLNEADNQRGLAHFLEHLMFKGTENFPSGSLIDYFQSIGMDFGNDANAHTTFNQTVYKLILPNGSANELDKAFSVMADYARRAQLNEEQVNQERGVILAEKRARDSASYRTQVASMEFAFRGTRLSERMVIGDEKILQQADRRILKDFYDSWYRPDNMILIVVGDMEMKTAEQLVGKYFAQLSPSKPKPECPEFGKLVHRGIEAFYHFEPELGKTNVSIESLRDLQLLNDSVQLEKEELLRLLGTMIMGYRLQRLQEEKDTPFTRVSYNSGDIIERIGYGSISAQTDPVKWIESLNFIERTLRQAIEYGFTDQEVSRAKKEILAELDARVLTKKSEDSRKIAQKILRHLESNRVYQSADQERSLYGRIIEQVTSAQVNQEFRAVWNNDSRLISVTGNVQLEPREDSPRLIADHYKKAVLEQVAGPVRRMNDEFPYMPISDSPQSVAKRTYFKDIDVERLVFANGLIVNLKKTDFTKNSVQIMANFGAGEQSEPAPGMAMLAEDIINISGSGKLPQSAIDTLVAGSSVELRFNIGETAFTWVGSSLYKDFELLIQILQTMLYDPGFRENQFANVMKKVNLMYQKMSREIDSALALDVQPFLAGGNPHFGLPSWDDISKIVYPDLEKWVHSFSLPKDLELSLVGDFDSDEVIRILEKYFGGVVLQGPNIPDTELVRFPAGGLLKVDVHTVMDKSMVVVAWPTEDYWDVHRTRRLHMLANVIEDRVRKVIREKLGAAYSPSVSNFSSRSYRGYGFLSVQVIVKPGHEEAIISEILRISEQLKEEGASTDELLRSKRPIMTSIFDNIRTNNYWLSSVLALSSRYPQQLEWPKTLIDDFSSIAEEEVTQLARQYLDNSRAAVARAVPSEMSARTSIKASIADKQGTADTRKQSSEEM